MSSSRLEIYCLLALFAQLSLSTAARSHLHLVDQSSHVALFIFGDSLFDAGNNNYLQDPAGTANFWPYGETFFNHPTGRFSDGRLISDFIAEYMKLPLLPPYLEPGNRQFVNGVNFASAGAGALAETTEGNKGRVIDFKTQVVYLKNVKKQINKQIGDEETKKLISTAIYLFSVGGNDYLAPSDVFKYVPKEDYAKMIIGNMTAAIKEIYEVGGRKFAFFGLGAFDCSPAMRLQNQEKGSCNKEATSIIKTHNSVFPRILREIQNQLKEFKYLFFDFYSTLHEIIDNPSKYGFKVANEACCGAGLYRGIQSSCGLVEGYSVCDDVSEYVFFDSLHPTEKVYKQLAHLLWSGGHNVSFPCNLREMIGSELGFVVSDC